MQAPRLMPCLALAIASTLAIAPGAAAAGAEAASLVKNGSFQRLERGRPIGWAVTEGARTGPGTLASVLRVGPPGRDDDVSVGMVGTAETVSWIALASDPFTVEPGNRLRLAGAIRTENVRQEANQYVNCHVALRFENARGSYVRVGGYPAVGTPTLTGTRDWTPLERVAKVPEGAVVARVICFLSMSGWAWFDDIAVTPVAEPEWRVVESDRFRFHDQEGDRLPEVARQANRRNLADLENVLGLKMAVPIDYFKYESTEQKGAVTGNSGNAHVEGASQVHTIWQVDRHEMVHLLTRTVGEPDSILFGEGIAVHLAGDWQGRDLDDEVRRLAAASRLPPLESLVEHESFLQVGEEVAYPAAGSFARHLIARSGMSSFKQAYTYGGGSGPSAIRFRRRLEEIYGSPLAALEKEWLAALGLGRGPGSESPAR